MRFPPFPFRQSITLPGCKPCLKCRSDNDADTTCNDPAQAGREVGEGGGEGGGTVEEVWQTHIDRRCYPGAFLEELQGAEVTLREESLSGSTTIVTRKGGLKSYVLLQRNEKAS